MSAININKNNFQNEVLNSDKPVLLDFWASWCAPCRMVVPIVEEIASERRDIKVGKINVDEEPELTNKFNITAFRTGGPLSASGLRILLPNGRGSGGANPARCDSTSGQPT